MSHQETGSAEQPKTIVSTITTILDQSSPFMVVRTGVGDWIVTFFVRGHPWQLHSDDLPSLPAFIRQQQTATWAAGCMRDAIADAVEAELAKAGLMHG